MMDKATMRLDVNKGWGTFGSTLFSGSNSVAMQATGKLPDSIEGFAGTAISGRLDISGNDLHHLAGGVTSGMVAGDGTFELRDNTLRASIGLKASSLSTNGLDLSAAVVNVKLTKLLRRPDRSGPASDATPFDGLQTELDAHVSGLEAGGYAVDSADADVLDTGRDRADGERRGAAGGQCPERERDLVHAARHEIVGRSALEP